MRVIVCGGRDFYDYELMCSILDRVHSERPIKHLWHGNAAGADTLAGIWAHRGGDKGISVHPTPAQWKKHGKRAGPIRNQQMLGNGIDLVIAFPGGRGTADMVARARSAGVEVMEIASHKKAPGGDYGLIP